MTLSCESIEEISPYVCGTDFSQEQFDTWLALVEIIVDRDDPGFTSTEREEALALLICHRIARKKGTVGLRSESIGSYSYSRAGNETSIWLDEYQALKAAVVQSITVNTNTQPYFGARRSDSENYSRLDGNFVRKTRVSDSTLSNI
jgi:hypothetical protein